MNDSCFSRSTDMWLVGRRVHNRLWELTNPTEYKGHPGNCPHCTDQSSLLVKNLTTDDTRIFFKWDSFLETFNEMYPTGSEAVPTLLVDADMLGKQRLELLQTYQRENPRLVVIIYMATECSFLAMQTDKLGFSGYITQQDAGYQWICLFDALKQEKPYHSPGWKNLLRQGGLMFVGDSSPVYPLTGWAGQSAKRPETQLLGQKVVFSTN